MTIADIITLDWTLDIAVCAKIALLAFAHSRALVAILDTGALLSATANTSHYVRFAFHCTVTSQKSSFTDTFCLLCTIRCTEPITRAHSALSVFCTHHSALFPQEPSLTRAEGDLLLLVVIAFAVSAAHAVISRAWAPVLTCVSTPRRQTLAHSLPCRVSFAFAIFTTDLLVQAQWALFITLGSHKLRLTPTASFLLLCIEKTRAVTSAALCAIFLESRTLLRTLGSSPSSCTAAFLWLVWPFTETKELRFLALECRVLAKFLETGFTATAVIVIVADVKLERIVTQEVGLFVQ